MDKTELEKLAQSIADKSLLATKEVLTLDEVSRYMGVSKSYIYKMAQTRQIPCYKPNGKLIFFDRAEVEQWLKKSRCMTEEELNQKAIKQAKVIKQNREKK